jgi:hypothetical protein
LVLSRSSNGSTLRPRRGVARACVRPSTARAQARASDDTGRRQRNRAVVLPTTRSGADGPVALVLARIRRRPHVVLVRGDPGRLWRRDHRVRSGRLVRHAMLGPPGGMRGRGSVRSRGRRGSDPSRRPRICCNRRNGSCVRLVGARSSGVLLRPGASVTKGRVAWPPVAAGQRRGRLRRPRSTRAPSRRWPSCAIGSNVEAEDLATGVHLTYRLVDAHDRRARPRQQSRSSRQSGRCFTAERE